MASYVTLNCIVLTLLSVLLIVKKVPVFRRSTFTALGVLTVLTAIFDNLIISAKIVTYDPTKISGIYIGTAPLEDFAYSLAAVLVILLLTHALTDRQ